LLLLAERANFDILIVALVVIAGFLYANGFEIKALVPLVLASLFKFYTIPLFLIFFLLNKRRSQKIVTTITFLVVIFYVINDLRMIKTPFPNGAHAKFGASIWTKYLPGISTMNGGEIIGHVSGFIIFGAVVLFVMVLAKYLGMSLNADLDAPRSTRIHFCLLYVSHISCFLLGVSFDYRLVFFTMCSLIFINSFSACTRQSKSIFMSVFTLAIWLTYASTGLEPLGDLFLEIATVYLGIHFVQFVKHDMKVQNAV
jgi:hypothetical protein